MGSSLTSCGVSCLASETVHRAVSRALPEAECRIEAVEGYAADSAEQRPRRQEQRRRRA